jgi:hypothetical protein
MPVKRRLPKHRRKFEVPAWAKRLKAGVRPAPGTDDCDAYAEWLYFEGEVPGLPPADSPEGRRLSGESSHAG